LEKVGADVIGLDPVGRIKRLESLWGSVKGSAALQNMFDRNLDLIQREIQKNLPEGTTVVEAFDAMIASPLLEDFLKQFEVLAALSKGEIGLTDDMAEAAAKQVMADANFGLTSRKWDKDNRLLNKAMENMAVAPGTTGLGRPDIATPKSATGHRF